jgi:hypothetical protein
MESAWLRIPASEDESPIAASVDAHPARRDGPRHPFAFRLTFDGSKPTSRTVRQRRILAKQAVDGKL